MTATGPVFRAREDAVSFIDSAPEPAFDRITKLAAGFLHVPISLVSVLDLTRNVFKSEHGLPPAVRDAREIPITHSYCRHVVASGEMLAVPDTLTHPLVRDNPTNLAFGVRAYLGFPVRSPAGEIICTLCVLDMKPREWTGEERSALETLAAVLASELALRDELGRRQQAEEHGALLFREMEHRVKNGLAKVQAIVSLTLRGGGDPETARRTVMQRIAALARTQSLLLQADWRSALLREILSGELDHYDGGERVRMEGPEIRVGSEDAAAIGMMAHELATNALKYGALAAPGGTITIVWREEAPVGERRVLRLGWTENGAALPAPPAETGFGSTLLDTLIVRQQNGRIERDWRPTGLHLAVTMELGPLP